MTLKNGVNKSNKRKSEWNEYKNSKREKGETMTLKVWESGKIFQGIETIIGEPI